MVAIIGSGVYGIALANLIHSNGTDVTIWTEKEIKDIIVPEGIKVTKSYEECLKNADIVFIVTAAKYTPGIFENIKSYLKDTTILILGSKGILDNGELIEEALLKTIPNANYAIISGPTFAIDIAALEPVGFTVATKDKKVYKKITKILNRVKLEYSSDTLGTEICGVLKNAYAIGSGMIDGFHYGPSIRCLYIKEVLNEIKYILKQLKRDEETAYNLCGVGDLVLTCTSLNSRNFTFGSILGLGSKSEKKEYLKNNTVEGYENLKILIKLFQEKSIDAPILKMVSEIVMNDRNPLDIIELLLQ